MTRRTEKLPTMLGVVAGSTATVHCPLGYTYHEIGIRMKAGAVQIDVAVADWVNNIDNIRVMVDGDPVIEITAENLVKLNQYYGQTLVDGMLPIFFSMPWMRTAGGEDATAFGTIGMKTFTVEVELKAGLANIELSAYAEQSDPTPWGPHLEIKRVTHPVANIGESDISGIRTGNYALVGIHIASDAIDEVEVIANNSKILEMDKVVSEAKGLKVGRVKQTGITPIDFIAENRLKGAFGMQLSDFRIRADFTAAGNMDVYVLAIRDARILN